MSSLEIVSLQDLNPPEVIGQESIDNSGRIDNSYGLEKISLGNTFSLIDHVNHKRNMSILEGNPSYAFQYENLDKYKKWLGATPDIDAIESIYGGPQYAAAARQSGWYLVGAALTQALVGHAIGGTLSGFGMLLDPVGTAKKLLGTHTEEWGQENILTRVGNWLTEQTTTNWTPVYQTAAAQKGWAPGDATWWASMAPSMASTLSLLIPTMAVAKGVGYISKITKLTDKIAKSTHGATKLRVADAVGRSLISRTLYTNTESVDTWKTAYDIAINEHGMTDQEAIQFASDAASHNFRLGYLNIWQDYLQWNMIIKGPNLANRGLHNLKTDLERVAMQSGAGSALRAVTGVGDKALSAGSKFSQKVGQVVGQSPSQLVKHGLLQGFEEYNIQWQKKEGTRRAEIKAGIRDESLWEGFGDRLIEHTLDRHTWDSAFWGFMGGVVFGGVSGMTERAFNRGRVKNEKESLQKAITNTENLLGDMKAMAVAISQGDKATVDLILSDNILKHAVKGAEQGTLELMIDTAERYSKLSDSEIESLGWAEDSSETLGKDIRAQAREAVDKMKLYRDIFNRAMETAEYSADEAIVADKKIINEYKLIETKKLRDKYSAEFNQLVSEFNNLVSEKVTPSIRERESILRRIHALVRYKKQLEDTKQNANKDFLEAGGYELLKGVIQRIDNQIKELEGRKFILQNEYKENLTNIDTETANADNKFLTDRIKMLEESSKQPHDKLSPLEQAEVALVKYQLSAETWQQEFDNFNSDKKAQEKYVEAQRKAHKDFFNTFDSTEQDFEKIVEDAFPTENFTTEDGTEGKVMSKKDLILTVETTDGAFKKVAVRVDGVTSDKDGIQSIQVVPYDNEGKLTKRITGLKKDGTLTTAEYKKWGLFQIVESNDTIRRTKILELFKEGLEGVNNTLKSKQADLKTNIKQANALNKQVRTALKSIKKLGLKTLPQVRSKNIGIEINDSNREFVKKFVNNQIDQEVLLILNIKDLKNLNTELKQTLKDYKEQLKLVNEFAQNIPQEVSEFFPAQVENLLKSLDRSALSTQKALTELEAQIALLDQSITDIENEFTALSIVNYKRSLNIFEQFGVETIEDFNNLPVNKKARFKARLGEGMSVELFFKKKGLLENKLKRIENSKVEAEIEIAKLENVLEELQTLQIPVKALNVFWQALYADQKIIRTPYKGTIKPNTIEGTYKKDEAKKEFGPPIKPYKGDISAFLFTTTNEIELIKQLDGLDANKAEPQLLFQRFIDTINEDNAETIRFKLYNRDQMVEEFANILHPDQIEYLQSKFMTNGVFVVPIDGKEAPVLQKSILRPGQDSIMFSVLRESTNVQVVIKSGNVKAYSGETEFIDGKNRVREYTEKGWNHSEALDQVKLEIEQSIAEYEKIVRAPVLKGENPVYNIEDINPGKYIPSETAISVPEALNVPAKEAKLVVARGDNESFGVRTYPTIAGHTYLDFNGRIIPLEIQTLQDTDIENVISILTYIAKLQPGEKANLDAAIKAVGDITHFVFETKQENVNQDYVFFVAESKKYLTTGIRFGSEGFISNRQIIDGDAEVLAPLRNFLKTKRYQINKKDVDSNSEVIFKKTNKEHTELIDSNPVNYKEWLLNDSSTNPAKVKTYLPKRNTGIKGELTSPGVVNKSVKLDVPGIAAPNSIKQKSQKAVKKSNKIAEEKVPRAKINIDKIKAKFKGSPKAKAGLAALRKSIEAEQTEEHNYSEPTKEELAEASQEQDSQSITTQPTDTRADIEAAYKYITTGKYEGNRKDQVNKVGEDFAKRFVDTLREKDIVKEGFRRAPRTDGSMERIKINEDTEGNNLGNDWSAARKFKDEFRKFVDAELKALEESKKLPTQEEFEDANVIDIDIESIRDSSKVSEDTKTDLDNFSPKDEGKDAFLTKPSPYSISETMDFESERSDVSKVFPDLDIRDPEHTMLGKAGSSEQAHAMTIFTPGGPTIVRSYKGAPKGTLWHEAGHEWMKRHLSVEERIAILEEAILEAGNHTYIIDGKEVNFGKIRTQVTSKELYEIAEEFLMEDFRNYVTSKNTYKFGEGSRKRNVFQRLLDYIVNFLENVLGRKLTSASGTEIIAQYERILSKQWTEDTVINKPSEIAYKIDGYSVEDTSILVHHLNNQFLGFIFDQSVIGKIDLNDLGPVLPTIYNKLFNNILADAKKVGELKGDNRVHKIILNNWDSLVKEHIKHLRDLRVQLNISDEIVQENKLTKDNAQYLQSNLINVKEVASSEVKLLIASLPGEVKQLRGFENAPLTVSVGYAKTLGILQDRLSNLNTIEEMVTTLMDMKSEHPYIETLLDRLGLDNTGLPKESITKGQFMLLVKFFDQMHKHNNDFITGIVAEDGGIYTVSQEETTRQARMLGKWKTNIKNKSKNNIFTLKGDRYSLNLDAEVTLLGTKYKVSELLGGKVNPLKIPPALKKYKFAKEFMDLFGIEIPQSYNNRSVVENAVNYLYESINSLIKEGTDIYADTIFDREVIKIRKELNILSRELSKLENNFIDNQIITSKGTEFGLQLKANLHKTFDALASRNVPKELMPFAEVKNEAGEIIGYQGNLATFSSVWYQHAMRGKAPRVVTLRTLGRERDDKIDFTDIKPGDMTAFQIANILEGTFSFPRSESRGMEYAVNFSADYINSNISRQEQRNVYKKYLLGEILTAIAHKNSEHSRRFTDNNDIDSELSFFRNIVPVEILDELNSGMYNNLSDLQWVSAAERLIKLHETSINQAIDNYIKEATNRVLNSLIELSLVVDYSNSEKEGSKYEPIGLSSSLLRRLKIRTESKEIKINPANTRKDASTITINLIDQSQLEKIANLASFYYTTSGIEYTKLVTGDLSSYSSGRVSAFHKRTTTFTSTIAGSANGEMVNTLLNRFFKRMDGTLHQNNRRVFVFNDVYVESSLLPILQEMFPEENWKAYGRINEADGASFSSLDGYRAMATRNKIWNNKYERTWNHEAQLGFKMLMDWENNNNIPQSDRKYTAEKFVEFFKEHLPDEIIQNPSVITPLNTPTFFNKMQITAEMLRGNSLPVLKFQGTGQIVNPELAMFNKQAITKTAIVPLLPSSVQGTPLFDLFRESVDTGLDVISFASAEKGSKVGNSQGQLPEFFVQNEQGRNTTINNITDLLQNQDFMITEISWADFGNQLDIDPSGKSIVTDSSQKRSLNFVDIFNNGEIVAEYAELQNAFREYTLLQNTLVDRAIESLKNRLGLVQEGDKLNVQQVEKLSREINYELERRLIPDNVAEGVNIILESSLKLFDAIPNKRQIVNMLQGMFRNSAIRIKRNGDMLTQVSSAGFESTLTDGVWTSNELLSYRAVDVEGNLVNDMSKAVKILPAQAMVSLPPQLIKYVDNTYKGNNFQTKLDQFNKDWKSSKFNSIRQFVANRIPGQHINSLEVFEIVKFLSPTSGSAIVVSKEIVAKSGSDFDIDKLTSYFNNYRINETGDVISNKYLTEQNSTIEERAKQLFYDSDFLSRVMDVSKHPEYAKDVANAKEELKKLRELDKAAEEFHPEIKEYRDKQIVIDRRIKQLRKEKKHKEATQLENDLSEYVLKEYRALKIIKDGIEVLEDTKKETIQEIVEVIKNLPIEQQNTKKAIENRINELSIQATLFPANYKALMRPNDSLIIKEQADKLNKKSEEVDMHSLLELGYNIDVAENQFGNLAMVGILAINTTSHSKMQSSPIKYNSEIVPLLFEEFDGVTGDLMLGYTTDREGNLISQNNSAGITGAVDAGKERYPAMSRINYNAATANAYQLLNRLGIDKTTPLGFRQLTEFFTSPIIMEFERLRKISESEVVENSRHRQSKKDIIESLVPVSDDYKFLYEYLSDFLKAPDKASRMEAKAELTRGLNTFKKNLGLLKQGEYKTENLKVLELYLFYSELGKTLQSVQDIIRPDTGLPKDRDTVRIRRLLEQRLRDLEIFENSTIDALINSTFVQSFRKVHEAAHDAFAEFDLSSVSPHLESIIWGENGLINIYTNPALALGETKITEAIQKIRNGLITAIIQATPKNEKALNRRYAELFQGPNSVAKRLHRLMQNEYFKENVFFKELLPVIDEFIERRGRNAEIDYIKLFNRNFTVEESNSITESIRELTTIQNAEIQKLMLDIFELSLLQSGIQVSPISFFELLPAELYQPIVSNIFREYLELESQDRVGELISQEVIDQVMSNLRFNSTVVPRFNPFRKGKYPLITLNQEQIKVSTNTNQSSYQYLTVELSNLSRAKQNALKKAGKPVPKEVYIYKDSGEITQKTSKGRVYTNKLYTRIPNYGDGYRLFEVNPQGDPSIIKRNRVGETVITERAQEDMDFLTLTRDELLEDYSQTTGETLGTKPTINFTTSKVSGYPDRTRYNASADATIALAVDFNSAGERLTKKSVLEQGKEYIPIDIDYMEEDGEPFARTVWETTNKLNSINAKTLNIAGNGIYTMKGKYTQQQIDNSVYDLLKAVIESPDLKTNIESIRTGGQTGVDEAGAKAAIRLNIPVEIHTTKDWAFRSADGKDIKNNEKAFKARFKNLDTKQQFEQEALTPKIKPGVQELFDSNPELANQVYEALGFIETIPVGWEKGKTIYSKGKPVKSEFKSGITELPNGNYLVRAYRTDDTGLGSKGFGQRGEGLYLSLTNPYPGRGVNTVEFEISPSDIVTYKEEFSGTIPYEKLTVGKGNFQDRIKLVGGKAFIGGINSSEDTNLEIVLYDKSLIDKANQSKKKVSNFTTNYKLYNLPTEAEKQQALQLYSQYLDTGKQSIEGFKEFVDNRTNKYESIQKSEQKPIIPTPKFNQEFDGLFESMGFDIRSNNSIHFEGKLLNSAELLKSFTELQEFINGKLDAKEFSPETLTLVINLMPNDHILKKKLIGQIENTQLYRELYNDYVEKGIPIEQIKAEVLGKALELGIAEMGVENTMGFNSNTAWRGVQKWIKSELTLNTPLKQASYLTALSTSMKLSGIMPSTRINMDPETRNKYFSDGETQKMSNILEKISNSNHALSALAKHLQNFIVDDININLLQEVKNEKGELVAGIYDRDTTTISISENTFIFGKGIETLILHEVLHALSVTALSKDSNLSKDFKKLYEYAKKQLGNQEATGIFYGLKNEFEFLTELFTNADFIKELEKIPATGGVRVYKNLFAEVFDLILELLGMKKGTNLYAQAFANATQVINADMNIKKEFNKQAEEFSTFVESTLINEEAAARNMEEVNKVQEDKTFAEALRENVPMFLEMSNMEINNIIDLIKRGVIEIVC